MLILVFFEIRSNYVIMIMLNATYNFNNNRHLQNIYSSLSARIKISLHWKMDTCGSAKSSNKYVQITHIKVRLVKLPNESGMFPVKPQDWMLLWHKRQQGSILVPITNFTCDKLLVQIDQHQHFRIALLNTIIMGTRWLKAAWVIP